VGAIAALTLTPSGDQSGGGGWACIFCSTYALSDAILNILLFVPLGIALRWTRLSAVQAVAVGFMITVGVESAQVFMIPGRDASLGDIITNTAGTGVGYVLAANAGRILHPLREHASRMSLAYALFVVGVVSGTGILLKPSFTDAAYYGQWTPNLGHLEWYRGTVLDARIGPYPLPSSLLEHTDSIRGMWLSGAPIEIRAVAGPKPPALASLFSIYDEHQTEIVLIGPDRDDLVLRYRTRAISLRLHQPVLRIAGAMDSLPDGDSLNVSVWRNGHQHCLVLNQARYCKLGFTAGAGWTILLDSYSFSAGTTAFLNAAWLAFLFIPVGLWMRANPLSAFGSITAALGLLMMPAPTGLLPTLTNEWIGAGFGIAAGVLMYLGVGFLGKRKRDRPLSAFDVATTR
jgi:hypothetical protein